MTARTKVLTIRNLLNYDMNILLWINKNKWPCLQTNHLNFLRGLCAFVCMASTNWLNVMFAERIFFILQKKNIEYTKSVWVFFYSYCWSKKKILLNLMLYLPAHLIFKINKIMLVWQGHILFPANISLLMITFTFSSNLDLIVLVLCSLI